MQWIYHNGSFVLYCRNYYIADSFMNPGIYFGGNGAVNELQAFLTDGDGILHKKSTSKVAGCQL